MNDKIMTAAVLAAFMICLVGCVARLPDSTRPKFQKAETAVNPQGGFKPLKGYRIILEPLTAKRTFQAGGRAEFSFRLQNTGSRPLSVSEWMMAEGDNLRIFHTPFKDGVKPPPPSEWSRDIPRPEKPVERQTMVLEPLNSVLIRRPLSFVDKLKPGGMPWGGRKFWVVAELNLDSVRAFTKPFVITVK